MGEHRGFARDANRCLAAERDGNTPFALPVGRDCDGQRSKRWRERLGWDRSQVLGQGSAVNLGVPLWICGLALLTTVWTITRTRRGGNPTDVEPRSSLTAYVAVASVSALFVSTLDVAFVSSFYVRTVRAVPAGAGLRLRADYGPAVWLTLAGLLLAATGTWSYLHQATALPGVSPAA